MASENSSNTAHSTLLVALVIINDINWQWPPVKIVNNTAQGGSGLYQASLMWYNHNKSSAPIVGDVGHDTFIDVDRAITHVCSNPICTPSR